LLGKRNGRFGRARLEAALEWRLFQIIGSDIFVLVFGISSGSICRRFLLVLFFFFDFSSVLYDGSDKMLCIYRDLLAYQDTKR
jgi:hypothetical protein